MVQSIAAQEVTLRQLKQNLGLQLVQDPAFFAKWFDRLQALTRQEQQLLDRVRSRRLTID